jgi:hypothetical protein
MDKQRNSIIFFTSIALCASVQAQTQFHAKSISIPQQ